MIAFPSINVAAERSVFLDKSALTLCLLMQVQKQCEKVVKKIFHNIQQTRIEHDELLRQHDRALFYKNAFLLRRV